MASETAATRTLLRALRRAGAFPQRYEDRLSAGIPDIGVALPARPGVAGATPRGTYLWLEGKFVARLPARPGSLVRLCSPAQGRVQGNWLRRLQGAGCFGFVWVRVAGVGWGLTTSFDWLLLGVARADLLDCARFTTADALVSELFRRVGTGKE